MHTFLLFFSWPTGSIWSNMIAWVICGGLAGLWSVRKIIKWNRKREDLDRERHRHHMNKLDIMYKEQRDHQAKIVKHLGIKE